MLRELIDLSIRAIITRLLLITCGCGGSLVDSIAIDRRVVGSNPALFATHGPWESPSLAAVCGA